MESFLEHAFPGDGIEWIRCFPAYKKPAPKYKGQPAEPKKKSESGISGEMLIEEMLKRLQAYYRDASEQLDIVVLFDDTDCRFREAPGDFHRWREDIETKVRIAADTPDIRFFAPLASPEIEAWFIADWENGFASGDRKGLSKEVYDCFRMRGIPVRGDDIEGYGGARLPGGGCTKKLSEDILDALGCGAFSQAVENRLGKDWPQRYPRALMYSKKLDGALMLRHVRPQVVANGCPGLLGEELKRLQSYLRSRTSVVQP